MKIGVTIPFWGKSSEVYTYNLLENLSKIDAVNKYTIYCENESLGSLLKKINNLEVKVLPFRYPFSVGRGFACLNVRLFPRILLDDVDILFAALGQALPIFMPRHIKCIIVNHDLSFLSLKWEEMEHIGIVSKAFKKSVWRFAAWQAFKQADRIISVSEASQRELIEFFRVPSSKTSVIYDGYNQALFTPVNRANSAKERFGITGNYILHLSGFTNCKNVPNLVKAFHKLRTETEIKHKLVLAGKVAVERDFQPVLRLIDQLGLKSEVILTGYIPDDELPALMAGADVFVLPSRHEGFGFPAVEAMGCGTPVVVSNRGSLPEVVGNAGVVVAPYDINELAEAMYQVLINHDLWQDLREKGLERARFFSWEKAAKEYLKVFEEVYSEGKNKNESRIRTGR